MARKTQKKRGGGRTSARSRRPSTKIVTARLNAETIAATKLYNKRMQSSMFKAARDARILQIQEDETMRGVNPDDDPVVSALNKAIAELGL